jgi:hypothetical protein
MKNIYTKLLAASVSFTALFLIAKLGFTRKKLNALVCSKTQANDLAGWKGILLQNGQLTQSVPVVSESFALWGQLSLSATLQFPSDNEKSDPLIVSTLSLQAPDFLPGVEIPIPGCTAKWIGFQKQKELKLPHTKKIIIKEYLNTETKHLDEKVSPPKIVSKFSENPKESSHFQEGFSEIETPPGGRVKLKLKSVRFEKLPSHDNRWEFEKGTVITKTIRNEEIIFSIDAVRKSDNKRFSVCENFEWGCYYVGWNVEKKALIFEDGLPQSSEIGYVINGIKKQLCYNHSTGWLLKEKGWLIDSTYPVDFFLAEDREEANNAIHKISVLDIFSLRSIKILEGKGDFFSGGWKSDGTLEYEVAEGKVKKNMQITNEMMAKGEILNEACGQDRSGTLKEVDLTKPWRKK